MNTGYASLITSFGMFLFSFTTAIPFLQVLALIFSLIASYYNIKKNKK